MVGFGRTGQGILNGNKQTNLTYSNAWELETLCMFQRLSEGGGQSGSNIPPYCCLGYFVLGSLSSFPCVNLHFVNSQLINLTPSGILSNLKYVLFATIFFIFNEPTCNCLF